MFTNKINFTLVLCFLLSGCAGIMDTPKVIWGSSTRALEEARAEAISKTYRCSLSDCYDAVLSLARDNDAEEATVSEEEGFILETRGKGLFDVFIKSRKKKHIVVMGIAGNVDTTEVGIFFSQPTLTTVKLEVASLSSSAKRTASEQIFRELDFLFSSAE